MSFDLKIKYNKTYFYFAIFFALVGVMFIVAAFMSFNDFYYALTLNILPSDPTYNNFSRLLFDLRIDFLLNIGFSIFSLILALFCSVTRINSSRSSRKFADI